MNPAIQLPVTQQAQIAGMLGYALGQQSVWMETETIKRVENLEHRA